MKAKTFLATVSLAMAAVSMAAAPSLAQTGAVHQPTVAEAALQAREQRKTDPHAKFVWTNDNLPRDADAISVVGTKHAEGAATAGPPVATVSNTASQSVADRAKLADELEAAKERLGRGKTDLNIAQRTLALDRQQLQSNPNFPADKDAQAKLASEAQQIADLQAEVDGLARSVTELERQQATAKNPQK